MLYVHRSERADRLVEILGDVLAEPLADPMTAEIVAVPTRGVERWLAQRLSHRLGAGSAPIGPTGCAPTSPSLFPARWSSQATAAGIGMDRRRRSLAPRSGRCGPCSSWSTPTSTSRSWSRWPPICGPPRRPDRPAAAQPARGDGSRRLPVHRFATVRHLADLYDHYGVHRPEMIRAWAAARAAGVPVSPVRPSGRPSCGAGSASASGSTARPSGSRPRRRGWPRTPAVLDLPPRLSLFGLTRLPASHLSVLQAIASWRDVHLFLLHPSGAAVGQGGAGRCPAPPAGMRRADDPTAALPANPLLRSWGRDAREMQLVLAAHGAGRRRVPARWSSDRRRCSHRIQADIRADRPPPRPGPGRRPGSPPLLDAGDRQPADPFVPRAVPPGGGDARRRPPPAGRRPHASSPAT